MSKYIDADALMARLRDKASPLDIISKGYVGVNVLSVGEINRIVDGMPAADVEPVRKWISVDERLPENAKDPDAFRPKYQICTSFGITEGWYGWLKKESGWYALIWFMDGICEEWSVDLERGDVPKVVFIPDGGKVKVYAWRDLPEPPKMDGGSE